LMAPSPIPRFDNPKTNFSKSLILLGAGREKKIYAVPPYTKSVSIAFDDYPFQVEDFSDKVCCQCGQSGMFMDELVDEQTGNTIYQCNDTSYCINVMNANLAREEVGNDESI